MGQVIEGVLTVAVSVMASSGMWAYFTKRAEAKGAKVEMKSAQTQLLLGMAHDRIVYIGMKYINRGWIYKDEYQDFMRYLYKPYSKFGGNGLADKVVNEVKSLPFKHRDYSGGLDGFETE